MTSKERNCSIDIFRVLCAILIVAIHTELFMDINISLGYVFSQIIPRIAVPFFFAVSGYFYIQKLEEDKKVFLPYVKKLFVTYAVWSLIYFILDFVTWGYTGLKGFVANCIYSFFLIGSHYHLWFFIALFICVCVTTLIFKLQLQKLLIPLSIVLYIIGCLGEPYYAIGMEIPVLRNIFMLEDYYIIRRYLFINIPYFVCGYAIYKCQSRFENIRNSNHILLILFTALLYVAEIIAVHLLELQRNIVITVLLYPMVFFVLMFLIKNPLPKYRTAADSSRSMANFTYYAHPLFIELIGKAADIPQTLMFVIVTLLTIVLGFSIRKINNRFLNKLVY